MSPNPSDGGKLLRHSLPCHITQSEGLFTNLRQTIFALATTWPTWPPLVGLCVLVCSSKALYQHTNPNMKPSWNNYTENNHKRERHKLDKDIGPGCLFLNTKSLIEYLILKKTPIKDVFILQLKHELKCKEIAKLRPHPTPPWLSLIEFRPCIVSWTKQRITKRGIKRKRNRWMLVNKYPKPHPDWVGLESVTCSWINDWKLIAQWRCQDISRQVHLWRSKVK